MKRTSNISAVNTINIPLMLEPGNDSEWIILHLFVLHQQYIIVGSLVVWEVNDEDPHISLNI